MRYRSLSILCTVLAVVSLLAAAGFGTLWTFENFVFAGWKFFPAHHRILDLREENLSIESYNALSRQLPDSTVLWKVPFQDKRLDYSTREITVTSLQQADLKPLLYMPWLETVHAEDCTDYALLAALQKELPSCHVLYTVTIGDQVYDQDTTAVATPNLDEKQVRLLECLPKLSSVNASGSSNVELVKKVQSEHPEWNVIFAISLGGQEVSSESESLVVQGATAQELAQCLPALTKLKELVIVNPDASAGEMEGFRLQYPQIALSWYYELMGQRISPEAEELDLSAAPMTSIAEVEKVANRLPNLKKLILEAGTISNEDMAAFREAHRSDYKVVWTIYFTDKCKARTDDTIFMPIKQAEYYFQEQHIAPLRYCEDMVCVDVGHAPIKSIDFVSYMPHLKYLILAWTQVTDITPISNCKELIYLEVDNSTVKDFTPLTGCTALEDLNIGNTYADITPLCSMTWLKNLWLVGRGAGAAYQLRQALPDTKVNYAGNATVGYGWRKLPNYYAMRDMLGMPYML